MVGTVSVIDVSHSCLMEAGLEEYTRSSFRKLFNYVSLSALIYRIKGDLQ